MRKSLLALLFLLLLSAGCSDAASDQATPPVIEFTPQAAPSGLKVSSPTPGGQADSAPDLARPDMASSELVVGPERFVFVLISTKTGKPIKDVPVVGIQFLKVHEDGTATKVSDAAVLYHNQNLPIGMFVARTTFTEPGKWGALVTIRRAGQDPYQAKVDFEVLAHGAVPMIGEMPPASTNLIASDAELKDICSAKPFDDMHSLTIADAMKSGKPTLILFATPGFCETLTCGPDLDVANALQAKYRDKANFIHIETPSVPQAPQGNGPTVTQWGLKSEPWIYMLDKTGKIAERFEGGLTLEEVEPEFAKLLQ